MTAFSDGIASIRGTCQVALGNIKLLCMGCYNDMSKMIQRAVRMHHTIESIFLIMC